MDTGSDRYEIPWHPQRPARAGVLALLQLLLPPLRRLVQQRDQLLAERLDWRARNDLLHNLLDEEHARSNELMRELTERRRQAQLTEPAQPYPYAWVFILTYGRSGSTLLQGILNATPGVLIRGENGGMLTDLWRFQQSGVTHRDRLNADRLVSPRHPWYGIDGFPVELSMQLLRSLVVETLFRPQPDTRLCGCKEIDWPAEDLDGFIAFLGELFPGVRFIVNTRNLDDTARSGWWARRADSRSQLEQLEERYLAVRERLGDSAFHVRFDDYVRDPATLAPLYEWLDLPLDVEVARRVLEIPHSYDDRLAERG